MLTIQKQVFEVVETNYKIHDNELLAIRDTFE